MPRTILELCHDDRCEEVTPRAKASAGPTPGRVHLICTLEPSRMNLLPQFIEHYAALGVEQFHLSLQFEPDTDSSAIARASEEAGRILTPYGLSVRALLIRPFSALALREHHDSLQRKHCRDTDWIVWADIDEFQVYPRRFRDLLDFAARERVDYFFGEFIDRVAEDGSLRAFDPGQSIWTQYPRQCHVSRDVAKANDIKVTCARAGVFLGPGNHAPRNEGPLRYYAGRVRIHHFKWDATVVTRLSRRVLPEWRERWPWWVESRNVLDFVERSEGNFRLPA